MPHHEGRDPDAPLAVAVVGAGFGGLCTAKRLLDEGIDEFLVFDRADSVGGTWHANTYPGAQCDIPAVLYSFSFAQRSDWSRLYPLREELEGYLREVCRDFGIGPHLRLGHEVLDVSWDEDRTLWRVLTDHGAWDARVVVGAFGPFSAPSRPQLPGLESFAGVVQHSAEWDHSPEKDWTGRRVGVVGTGASGVQIIPRAAEAGRHLTVFQRTPTWIMPHPDRPVPPWARQLLERVPATRSALRTAVDLALEAMVYGLVWRPGTLKAMELVARGHLARQVRDPGLRRALTPRYTFGCKRPTFSNTYYPALAAPTTELVTETIREVVPEGVVTADGVLHELDVLVLATGFRVAGHPFFERVHGTGGRSLAECWAVTPRCYLGSTTRGFPNLFQILGPNAAVYTSMVVVIEAQVEYVLSALKTMRRSGIDALEVREEVVDEYLRRIDAVLDGSVWNSGGCTSYYLDSTGRNIAWYPGFHRQFRRATAAIDPDDYEHLVTGRERAAPSETVCVGRSAS